MNSWVRPLAFSIAAAFLFAVHSAYFTERHIRLPPLSPPIRTPSQLASALDVGKFKLLYQFEVYLSIFLRTVNRTLDSFPSSSIVRAPNAAILQRMLCDPIRRYIGIYCAEESASHQNCSSQTLSLGGEGESTEASFSYALHKGWPMASKFDAFVSTIYSQASELELSLPKRCPGSGKSVRIECDISKYRPYFPNQKLISNDRPSSVVSSKCWEGL